MNMTLTDPRTPSFRRNEQLEYLLKELNANLQASENLLIESLAGKSMQFPLVLVMGPLRSGTTLFMQWLANTGLVAYPTNLLSRFYQAPIIGAKIQLLLTDPRFNFRDELGEFIQHAEYISENGKTKGVLAPNEFWYFWRRFLAEPNRDIWTDTELKQSMDVQTLQAELSGMMQVFQKPFATKGMLFNYNIPFLDTVFENILFIQIKRDPIANAASILQARIRQMGSEKEWYSFKIPEYDLLREKDPIIQACGQVYYINRAIDSGLAEVREDRKLVVHYEEFCLNPEAFFSKIVEKIGMGSESSYNGPASFNATNPIMDSLQFEQAYAVFEEGV